MPLYLKDKMVSGVSLGVPGKSAYEAAKEAGYTGTETEFNQALEDVPGHISNRGNPHRVTASQVGAYTKEESNTLLEKKANTIKKTTVTLSTSWSGSASPYTQSITISGITANSKVDLQPDATIIAQMANDSTTALYIVNNNGSLTAYAVGMKPTASMTVQATVTEVSA